MLKRHAEKGFRPGADKFPLMPEFGFGDPASTRVVRNMVDYFCDTGAVRHGAECFNYYFPQEMDSEFLVVWEGYDGKPWRHVSLPELRAFLLERVSDGFTFPLNPKWICCDEGWRQVFDALLASAAARDSIDVWFPARLRDELLRLCDQHPDGYAVRVEQKDAGEDADDARAAADLAEYELRQHIQAKMRKARVKLRTLRLLTSQSGAKPPVQPIDV